MSVDPSDLKQPWPEKGDRLITERGKDWIFNAWLPGHGHMTAHIEGYDIAAKLIWKEIEINPRTAGIDFLVYPLVFLCRHYVELSLKDIITIGHRIEGTGGSFPTTHKLMPMWGIVRGMMKRIDGTTEPKDVAAMTELIKEFDQIDPESFAFRYPATKDGTPSTPGREWLSLVTFQSGMEKMRAYFHGVRSSFDYYESNIDQRDY